MTDIRIATAADAAMLARLRYEFRTRDTPGDENKQAFLDRCEAWMRDRLAAQGAWYCRVAERDGTAVGNIWLNLIEKIPNPVAETEFHAYITNFYVLEDARGRGVGSRLLETTLEWCRQRSVHAVILWPSERSRSLYERHGFAVRDDLLELIVTEK